MKKQKIAISVLLVLITYSLFLMSCTTLQQDVMYSTSLKSETMPQLDKIEEKLLEQHIEYNADKLQIVENDLKDLMSTPSTDANYLARINALYADINLIKRSKGKAKKYVAEALKYNATDEYALVVESRCLKSNQEKIAYLETKTSIFTEYYRLKAELANNYFLNNEYAKAVAEFDNSLPFLPNVYKKLYSRHRDTAYAQYNLGDDVDVEYESVLAENPLTLIGMTILAQENTDAFNTITGNAKWKASMLADRLRAAGWYRSDANIKDGLTRRKDASIFLWHFICGNNSAKMNQYSNKYKYKTKSPVVDIPIGSEYFDATLGMVIEDIIPLIDGKVFNPEGDVSGYEFFEWLKKANEIRQ